MNRSLESVVVGALAGLLVGLFFLWSDLSAAFSMCQQQAWWDQRMFRLVALEWGPSFRALTFFCLGGAMLGALSGGRLALGGRLTTFLGSFVLVVFPVVEIARSMVATQPPCDSPNIVWIVLDALRADHLGSYGYQHDTSPFLDELAHGSTRFEFAVSQESYTLASAASYFTSTYPPVHGVLYDEPQIDLLADEMLTAAEVLADIGYSTAAFVFNPHLQARYRFGQGFEVYDDSIKKAEDGEGVHVHDVFDTAERMHNKVEGYLKERAAEGDSRPAALYLHYRDIHGPYVPPPPYHEMFAPEDWSAAQRAVALRGTCRSPEDPSPKFIEDLEYRFAQYDGEIRYTDDALRSLFELLGEYGIDLTNTVVVVTADHGEEFRDPHPDDQQGWTHGRTLYVEQVRVPLIISLPGDSPSEGQVIEAPVELLDLAPTLIELASCEGDALPDEFQGRSLLPLLQGGTRPERPVFSGGNYSRGLVIADGMAYYAFDKKTKSKERRQYLRPDEAYVGNPGAQLFDMTRDPRQTTDLVDEQGETRKRLEALLGQWLDTEIRHGATGTAEYDDETVEQLRALGYLGGTDGEGGDGL
jgi:arylsulfatase A-like enzyme